MKTWDEVKKVTLSKLFMDEAEADQQGYLRSFPHFANECLNLIANSVKPKYVAFEISVSHKDDIPENLNKESMVIVKYSSDNDYEYEKADENKIYKVSDTEKYKIIRSSLVLTDEESDNVEEGYKFKLVFVSGNLITMPDNFISFADMVEYLDGEPGEYNIYFGRDKIKLVKPGNYVIYYNALYDELEDDVLNNSGSTNEPVYIDGDQSVINCLPSYIASQILAQDDTVRATQLKNEFEVLLSRLDNDVMYETKHFKSTGGWY